jgi:structural maintenance of chromosome 1
MGVAVTVEGTIIHKSGLITGGRSTQDSGKKWEEKGIQGASFILDDCPAEELLIRWRVAGLSRARDNIQNQLSELVKPRPRNEDDDDLISEMTRLEAVLQVSRDDLVRWSPLS